jgi:hypothetical protein
LGEGGARGTACCPIKELRFIKAEQVNAELKWEALGLGEDHLRRKHPALLIERYGREALADRPHHKLSEHIVEAPCSHALKHIRTELCV